MICFRSLIFWYLQQLARHSFATNAGCDLLSFFDFLIFTTMLVVFVLLCIVLWFAFVLWFSDIYNNWAVCEYTERRVVICFRSLIFWYLQQSNQLFCFSEPGCDLLSFFNFLIFTTIKHWKHRMDLQLWFAFVLWFSDIYNNSHSAWSLNILVVICFRSLIFWYLQQWAVFYPYRVLSCDLLSFFDFLIFTTILVQVCIQATSCDLLSFFDFLIFTTMLSVAVAVGTLLWFAFVLWFSDIYNNAKGDATNDASVVICFRSLIFWYLQQCTTLEILPNCSCDLLSFFDFLIFTTILQKVCR